MIAIEKIVYYSQFPRGGGTPWWEVNRESTRVNQGTKGEAEPWSQAFTEISMGRNERQGKQV